MRRGAITLMLGVAGLVILMLPTLAMGINPGNRPAPLPLLGAGLPALMVVSGGYLWLRRRR